jgi:hypothetical protein
VHAHRVIASSLPGRPFKGAEFDTASQRVSKKIGIGRQFAIASKQAIRNAGNRRRTLPENMRYVKSPATRFHLLISGAKIRKLRSLPRTA